MGGSAYFAGAVVVLFAVLTFVASPVFIIPGVVLLLAAVFSAPILAALSRSGHRQASGVPTTAEASYEPVAQPEEPRA